MFAGIAVTSAVALAALTSRADAHGYLEEPKPTWANGQANPGWVVLIDNYWDIGSGGDQCGKFKTMAKQKGVSVKDVVLDMVGEDKKCGNTLANASPQPVPTDGKAKWLGNGGGGFTHVGPCEIYLDDKMVLHGDNCEDEYKGGGVGSTVTSDMPVDYSSCNGDCTLTFYWLAFQNAQWQAYINCVPLKGSGSSTQDQTTEGSTTQTESSSNSAKTTEAPSTDKQSTESSSTGNQETRETQAPVATTQATQAPSASTQTEAPSTEIDTKCKAPARRLRKKTAALSLDVAL